MTNLPSQVGFYLLPPEESNDAKKKTRNSSNNSNSSGGSSSNNGSSLNSVPYPGVSRHWKSQNHLDAISEVSEESRTSTPKSGGNLEPKLLR